MSPGEKRFRVAFSFAGEKRNFVASVAAILAKRFGEPAILYDRYHRAEFSRDDLAFYLSDLYAKSSDLVVAVLCPGYQTSEWCGLEWRAIFGLIKTGAGVQVMLSRFGLVEGEGLQGLAGYTDLDEMTPEQAADGILERLALNKGLPKEHYKNGAGGRPAHSSIPNNLPRLQSFFGRERELAAIREALDPESRTWGALIDGPGGMGKTSLAIRAAYDCPPGLFQQIAFVSLKSRELDDDGVRELSGFLLSGLVELLNELARELDRPDIVKAPENQRIRLLLDALRSAQALLVLDNLESLTRGDRDQLFTFVRRLPQGCKAILTSRRRIGSGSDLVILERLEQAAALATIADLARHNPLLGKTSEAERIALYEHTGGNPLLLRWTAGQLGRGSCRTLADALSFLQSCPPDNDPLEFIFGDLAREFTAEETAVLATLSHFTLPAKVGHLAESAGFAEQPVATALRTLANRSLVIPDQEETAFTLVPMVADFLRRKRPGIIAEVAGRLEEQAYALIVENGDKKHECFPVLDGAWPTVAAALPLLTAGPNSRLQAVCNAFCRFLDFTGRWDEWLSISLLAETKAMAVGDHDRAGWRAHDAGWLHFLRGEADAVLGASARAAMHWQSANAAAAERAAAIRLGGLGHRLKADYHAAIDACREALDLLRAESPESQKVVSVLNSLATAEREAGDLAASECDFREALRVARAVKDAEGIAMITGNLAELSLDHKDWPRAEALAREALPLAENVGRQELIASDCRRIAEALVEQRRADDGLPYARRAVDILTQLSSPDLERAAAILRRCES